MKSQEMLAKILHQLGNIAERHGNCPKDFELGDRIRLDNCISDCHKCWRESFREALNTHGAQRTWARLINSLATAGTSMGCPGGVFSNSRLDRFCRRDGCISCWEDSVEFLLGEEESNEQV